MLLTPEQLIEILNIIRDHHDAFIANTISPDALPPETLQRLKDLGLYSPKMEAIKEAYLYGHLVGQSPSKTTISMGVGKMRERIPKVEADLGPGEKQAIKMAALNAAQYITGLGQRVSVGVNNSIQEADRKLRVQNIQDATALNVAKRKAVKNLASDLHWQMDKWERDWTRVAITEKHMAMQQGLADHYRKSHGPDSLVAKRTMPDACKHCKRLYLDDNGNPKIFKLSELEANGTNVGKKVADWLPVVGALHPHCQCQLIRIPDGWAFNKDGDIVPESMIQKSDPPLRKSWKPIGKMVFQGIPIVIESKPGMERRWCDQSGTEGVTIMSAIYGYIPGIPGDDGDELDVYVGPDKKARMAYVVDQKNPHTGLYDEKKCMVGFSSTKEAQMAYRRHLDRDDFVLRFQAMSMDAFKRWLLAQRAVQETFQQGDPSDGMVRKSKGNITKEMALVGVRGIGNPSPGTIANYIRPTPRPKRESYKTSGGYPVVEQTPEQQANDQAMLDRRRKANAWEKEDLLVPVTHRPVKHEPLGPTIETLIGEVRTDRDIEGAQNRLKKWRHTQTLEVDVSRNKSPLIQTPVRGSK